MSDPKLISPLLDNFIIGDPISEHDGVLCCPAISKETDEKYIVKIISIPESQTQVDALLLSGAFADRDSVTRYFKSIADSIIEEIGILQKLAQLEGFTSVDAYQIVAKDDGLGFDIYLLSAYRSTLRHLLRKTPMTHAKALNLGLDLCAALSVARRMGYMYVDLKPTNIYLDDSQEFRIGDLGFLNIGSLQYASLPERYNSEYTPPEIADAFSDLNQTLDVYAVGLILYQVYNNGNLPEMTAESIPAPAYADTEMSAIILKACAANHEDRWQSPVEMGQALVNYMQQKGAPDVLIVPADNVTTDTNVTAGMYEGNSEKAGAAGCTIDSVQEGPVTEESIYEEDSEGNLVLIGHNITDTADVSDMDYSGISDDVYDLIAQVDELIAHETPAPVVQPEPIDVPIPQVVIPEKSNEDEAAIEARLADFGDLQDAGLSESEDQEDFESEDYEDEYDDYAPPRRRRHTGWIIWVLILLIIGMITAGAFWGYNNYYLQSIEDVTTSLEDGGTLIVTVTTNVNEKSLIVICKDLYGNTRRSPVLNGTARFTGLTPASKYNVVVTISGFHKLIGKTTTSVETPAQTEISDLAAITASTDGSVLLTFKVNGPGAEQWNVSYKDKSGTENNIVFTGDNVTVNGLTVGQEYTFTITPVDDIDLVGKNTIKYVARSVVRAANMVITGCYDNNLCVEWKSDTGIIVDSWTVNCFNDDNTFNTSMTVKETSAIIKVPDDSDGYTVVITANGMQVSERIHHTKGTTTITDFIVSETTNGTMNIKWKASGGNPEQGFILKYTVDGMPPAYIPISFESPATIDPIVPGGKYVFEILSTNNVPVIYRCTTTYTANKVDVLDKLHSIGVSRNDLTFTMCQTPEVENWREIDNSNWDIRSTFTTNESISLIGQVKVQYDATIEEPIEAVFIIRNEAGDVVALTAETTAWNVLVKDGLFKLDLPTIPAVSGKYDVTLLLNNSTAYITTITITGK